MTMKSAAASSSSVDYWRKYFKTGNLDIFDIIDHAIIMVAASDCPKRFRLNRDRIAERLFSSRCSGCKAVEPPIGEGRTPEPVNPSTTDEEEEEEDDPFLCTTQTTAGIQEKGSMEHQNIEPKQHESNKVERSSVKIIIKKRPSNIEKEKIKCMDEEEEVDMETKLEASKRKLQERYQQAQNAKRPIMKLQHLPPTQQLKPATKRRIIKI